MKLSKTYPPGLALAVLLLTAGLLIARVTMAPSQDVALAQGPTYDLSWWTLDGGGHTWSTGGTYTLGGTIGQVDAGPTLSNGGYSLDGGFWTGVTALERYPLYLPVVERSD